MGVFWPRNGVQIAHDMEDYAVQIYTHMECSADNFKFLWMIRGLIEKEMIKQTKRVTNSFVDFIGGIAKGAPGAEALCEDSKKVCLPQPYACYTFSTVCYTAPISCAQC